MNWQPPARPSELAESRLIEAILSGEFPPDSTLPAERELAGLLGVTRPTLREALQRLARDGWLEIRQGHPTRVRDYWREGQLAVLLSIVSRPEKMPADIVPSLLEVRRVMAPAYTAQAIRRAPQDVAALLEPLAGLPDAPADYTAADWRLHHGLTVLSGNPVYTLILNGFGGLYSVMGLRYFALPAARRASLTFYLALLEAARRRDPELGEEITRQVMVQSIAFWNQIARGES
jgi:GntR family negative regulator for fad regulon and positive regulator of fabA